MKPGGLEKLVFLGLGRGGVLRSMTHCGGGGGVAGGSCAIMDCDVRITELKELGETPDVVHRSI